MAGREISQKRKKHIKSLVLVPDDAGMVFAVGSAISPWRCALGSIFKNLRILFKLGHIDRNITFMQSPPMLAWTPYQMLQEQLVADHRRMLRRDPPCHRPSVEDAPKAAPNTKRGASDHWECDVKDCSGTGISHNEGRNNAVSDPDAEPCLPPHHERPS
jgi:hypothetical protein